MLAKRRTVKRRRLGEHAEKLDYRHDGDGEFKPQGHIGPEHFFPVVLGAEYVYYEECNQRQHERHGDVAGDVGAAGEYYHQAQQVGHEYEEEYREEVGAELAALGAEGGLDYTVVYELDKGLDGTCGTAGSRIPFLAVPCGHIKHHPHYQQAGDEYGADVFGDGEVEGRYSTICVCPSTTSGRIPTSLLCHLLSWPPRRNVISAPSESVTV